MGSLGPVLRGTPPEFMARHLCACDDRAAMDRYATDPLAARPARRALPQVQAEPGLVVEDVETGFVGAVLRCEKSGGLLIVTLEDRRGA